MSGSAGVVQLKNIERLHMQDGKLGFDETSERAYRLYEAAFNREPDWGGLGYWIGELDQGLSFNEVSARFIDSPEFRDLYGPSIDDQRFVTEVYRNVLERDPDEVGADYWGTQISGGMSRAEVLARFSDSPENRANVAASVDDGVFFI